VTTWLSQDAYDKLKAEYDHRTGPWRHEIKVRIEAAREEGDLKENGGYHAAREEQGKNEARVRQLKQLLETAQVGDAPAADGTAQAGMVISVRFLGGPLDGEEETFLLGSREAAGTTELSVYSPQSPLGGAVMGQPIGSEVTYTLPNGRELTVKVLDAVTYTGG
jgi:transcription elongation factor GreA